MDAIESCSSTLAEDEEQSTCRDRTVVEAELDSWHVPQVMEEEFSTFRCYFEELAVDLNELEEGRRSGEVEDVLEDL